MGRIPAIASPMLVPMMPDSARGVSVTRAAPKRACRPSVTRNTPPLRPTSSPRTTTRGSFSISWVRARLMAWTRVRLAIFDSRVLRALLQTGLLGILAQRACALSALLNFQLLRERLRERVIEDVIPPRLLDSLRRLDDRRRQHAGLLVEPRLFLIVPQPFGLK